MEVTFKLRPEDGAYRSEEGDRKPQVGNGTWEEADRGGKFWHKQGTERRPWSQNGASPRMSMARDENER